MIAAGQYFTINKARQFGKTTILQALADYLKDDYVVLSLDFQRLSYADFAEEAAFVSGMARDVYRRIRRMENIPDRIIKEMHYLLKKDTPDEEHRQNSPWNIAADFEVNMSFTPGDIAGMLRGYEADHSTAMDVIKIAGLIHEYTSGYPFLVSRLCKIMDEELTASGGFYSVSEAWTEEGVREAVKILLSEKNTLFESLIGKLNDYPELKKMIYLLLFQGRTIAYNADDHETDMLLMFGFIKVDHAAVQIANRIFETRLYNYFLTLPEVQNGEMYRLALCNNPEPGIRSVQI